VMAAASPVPFVDPVSMSERSADPTRTPSANGVSVNSSGAPNLDFPETRNPQPEPKVEAETRS
jgi:hypothetical protein